MKKTLILLSRALLFIMIATSAVAGNLRHPPYLVSEANSSPSFGVLLPRLPFDKPSRDDLVARQAEDSAIVKFADGSGIRLRERNLTISEPELDIERATRYGL